MASVSPPLAPRESIPLAPMHLWHAWHSVTSRLRLRGRCGAHGTGLSGGALGCSWCRCRRGSDVYIATVAHRDNWRHVCLAWSCPLVWAPLSPPLVPLSGSHSPFWSRRGGDIHAAFVWQAWHRWYWAGSGGALGRVWCGWPRLPRPSRPPRPTSLAFTLLPDVAGGRGWRSCWIWRGCWIYCGWGAVSWPALQDGE